MASSGALYTGRDLSVNDVAHMLTTTAERTLCHGETDPVSQTIPVRADTAVTFDRLLADHERRATHG